MYQQQWGSNYQSNAPARRQAFISRVYGHLAGGFLVFAVIEGLLLNSPIGAAILAMVFGFGQIGWLLLMGIFMLISWIARSKLASSPDPSKQYLGYGLYILIEAVVFLPLLYIATDETTTFDQPPVAALARFSSFITSSISMAASWRSAQRLCSGDAWRPLSSSRVSSFITMPLQWLRYASVSRSLLPKYKVFYAYILGLFCLYTRSLLPLY